MRLYIACRSCNSRMYLNVVAISRAELAQKIGYNFTIKCPHCNVLLTCNVNQVFAEQGNNVAGGAVIGGLIGLIGGPLGMIIGGAIGGALGNGVDEQEHIQVNQFNEVFV